MHAFCASFDELNGLIGGESNRIPAFFTDQAVAVSPPCCNGSKIRRVKTDQFLQGYDIWLLLFDPIHSSINLRMLMESIPHIPGDGFDRLGCGFSNSDLWISGEKQGGQCGTQHASYGKAAKDG